MKSAWEKYAWCERAMCAFDFINGVIGSNPEFPNPLNTVLPLVSLERLDDAAIAECLDGGGMSAVILEIASPRNRL